MTTPTTPSFPYPPQQPSPRVGPSTARYSCAACKHQRRKCSPYCPLAPYFPSHKDKEFHNVHKLFGINKVVKLLKNVPEKDREDAMISLNYEAYIRSVNPVGGCYSVIRCLQEQINRFTLELDFVLQNLARARFMQNSGVYGHQMEGSKEELVKVEMVERLRSSSNQEMDFLNLETARIEIVQQFLNDNPTELKESNDQERECGVEKMKNE